MLFGLTVKTEREKDTYEIEKPYFLLTILRDKTGKEFLRLIM